MPSVFNKIPGYIRDMHLSPWFILFLFLGLFPVINYAASEIGLSDAEKDWLVEHPVIRIGVDPHYAPYSYQDDNGNYHGAAVDFIDRISALLGARLEIVPGLDWNQIVEAGRNKDLDVIATIVQRPERDVFLNFTSAYLPTPLVILQRSGEVNITHRDQLKGMKIALVKGFSSSKRVVEEYPDIIKYWVDKPLEALQAVASGQADAHVGSIGVSTYMTTKAGIANLKVVAAYDLNPTGQRLGVRKDWPQLVPILEKALAAMDETEKLAILQRWVPVSVPAASTETKPEEFKLTDEQKAWLDLHKPLKVAVMDGWPPFNYVDEQGRPSGIGMDYIKALEQRIGSVFTVIPGEWKRIYKDVAEKRLDLILDITPKPSREPLFNFTTPYMEVPHVIVAGKDARFIENENALQGKTLALEQGFGNVKYFEKNYPQVSLKLYTNTALALDAVSRGEADAYAGNRVVALYLMEKNFITNLRIHGRLSKPSSALAIGVRKDWPELRDILQRVLNDIDSFEQREILSRSVRFAGSDRPLVSAVQLTDEEKQWIRENPEIRVGGEASWPPFDERDSDGVWKGITPDFLALILKQLGIKAHIVTDPSWSEKLDMLRNRELDMMGSMAYSDERAEYLNFAGPYFISPYVIVSRVNDNSIVSLNSLKGRTIAMEKGYFLTGKLEKEYPHLNLLLVDQAREALLAVSDGSADAYIGNRAVISHLLEKELLTDLKISVTAPFKKTQLYFGIRKDMTMLHQLVQKVLDSLTEDDIKRIHRKWLPINFVAQQGLEANSRLQLSDTEKAWLAEHKSIRLGVDSAWAPLEFIDETGEYKGLSSEYMQIFSQQLGINLVKPSAIPWTDVLSSIKERSLDILPLISRTPEREEYLTFTHPYLDLSLVIFTQRNSTPINGLDDLPGKKIAVVDGYSVINDLERDYPTLELVLYPSVKDALYALSAGKVDAFVDSLAVGGYLIGLEGFSNLQVAAPTPYHYQFGIAVRKDWPELAAIFNKVIDALTEQQKNEIYRRWFTVKYDHQVDYTLLWRVLGIAGLIILLGSIWLRQTRRANSALQTSRERLAMTLESAELGSWEYYEAPNQKPLLYVDEIYRQQHKLEVGKRTLTMEQILDNIAASQLDEHASLIRNFLSTPHAKTIVFDYLTRDEKRWIYAHGHTLEWNENGLPVKVVGITQDITDRYKAQQALEQASRFKSEFLANMSHEIRTPMNAVVGLGHLLAKTSLDNKQRDYVHKIQVSAQSLLGIIDDILDFSKIEAGQLKIEKIPFKLEGVFENLSILVNARIANKSVEFLYDIAQGIPGELLGDPYRIGQILTNLVSNAIKFTEQGNIIVRVKLLNSRDKHVMLRFEVEDSGLGIAPEKLDTLFDAFIQADGSTTREFGGTGLGLSISQQLCLLMNGDIGAQSTPGVGSLFWFELPLEFSGIKNLPQPDPDLRGLSVLLVDDNPLALEVLTEMLASMTFKVKPVASGKEALSWLHEPDVHFDLVLLDWRMPDPDGHKIAMHIHEEFAENRPIIIMMTAYGREAMEQEIDDHFIEGFLIKPLTSSMLFDAIVLAYESRNQKGSYPVAETQDEIEYLSGNVLLVEDNDINQQVARELLEQMGVTVATVTNGQEAVDYVKDQHPDLVLMDIQMPVMDGYEATRQIRQLPETQGLPIYAMTANALVGDAEKSVEAGMDGHISKPVDPQQLYDVLSGYLEKTESVPDNHSGSGDESVKWQLPAEIYPGMNFQQGLKRVGGNTEFYLKLLQNFVLNHGDSVNEMEELIKNRDFSEATRKAHTLKGVGGNIGASLLQDSSDAIEAVLKHGEVPSEEIFEEFSSTCQNLFDILVQVLPTEDTEPAASLDQSKLVELINAMERADAKSTRLYETMRSSLTAQLTDEQVSKLDAFIDDYEFESAAEVLRDAFRGQV